MRSLPLFIALLTTLFSLPSAHAAPSLLNLTNSFGEKSANIVGGTGVPLPGNANVILMNGATTPVNGGSGTGAGLAAKGSLYIAQDTGVLYQNTNTKASPTWTASTGTGISAALTGFVAGAGTISATDTVLQGFNKAAGNELNLQNGTFVPQTETVSAAGAISITKMETTVSNGTGGSYAATLAAPSSQDGQIKIIKMGTATHTVTLACTNISFSGAYTPTGTTTLTFTATGDSAVFMAVGTKWVYLGGSAAAT